MHVRAVTSRLASRLHGETHPQGSWVGAALQQTEWAPIFIQVMICNDNKPANGRQRTQKLAELLVAGR
ncbi:hypothetical protein CHH28_13040 [Bacterioplanes sanyensis]|uniref:Uncharacterized protein n=1 Tax=Bacterioplanes sanyensis TaxID=1249553 RepID=A0A222FMU1_9GAMM|nr:hypothetical protein CHH28_13040 [Bacterioplanes sanyensis]